MAAVRNVFTLVLFHLSFFVAPSFTLLEEAEPLLRFKRFLNVANRDLISWRAGTDPCGGKWFGIRCMKKESVRGIHIRGLDISGTVDVRSLLDLKDLRTIRFENTSLSGDIPPFYLLRQLRGLLLSNNKLSGKIKGGFFFTMNSLKTVSLDNNNFSGRIPGSLMQLSELKELNLSRNQFSGRIPEVVPYSLLELVDVSNNRLEGEIPKYFKTFNKTYFDGNLKLCGRPVNTNKNCDSEQLRKTHIRRALQASLAISVIFFFLVIMIQSRRQSRKSWSRLLDKEHLSDNDPLELHIPSGPAKTSAASTRREGSNCSSRRGSSLHCKGKETGDFVMLNSDITPFGLPDLMKAAADMLGNGSTGSAYKAVMASGMAVVVKRLRNIKNCAFDEEMRRLGSLRHPNVLAPLAYYYRQEEKLMVSEFMPKSSLLHVLHGDRGIVHSELTWPTRWRIIQGIASGMAFLHKEFANYELPHGNLKSSNVLLDENYDPVISDYALYPLLQANSASQLMFAFKTPEFIECQQVSPKSDVYCLGIIILEILTGEFPSLYLSDGKGGTDIIRWVQSSVVEGEEEELIDPRIASDTDSIAQMVELIRVGAACIESKPEERLDMNEAVRRIEEVRT